MNLYKNIYNNIALQKVKTLFFIAIAALCLIHAEPAHAQTYGVDYALPERPLDQYERINFQPGATSALRSDIVSMNGSVTYYVRASAEQWMELSVTGSGAENVALVVYSPNSDYLYSADPRSWSGYLPDSGDYQIKVYSTLGIFDKSFDLNVSIVTPEPEEIPHPIERISFQPGATSALRGGVVTMNSPATYKVRAVAGQQMDLTLGGPDAQNVAMSVFSPSGDYRFSMDQFTWSEILLESGDYEVTLYSILGILDKHFDLNVSIVTPQPEPVLHHAERINFQPGATSAVRSGTVAMNGSITYNVWAAAGQQMDLAVSGTENVAMEVYGPSGAHLFSANPHSWSGTLPSNGDYQIKVYSILGLLDKHFDLDVSIIH